MAVRAVRALQLGLDDQAELAAAARAMLGVRHVHMKTATTAQRRDASAAEPATEVPGLCGRATHGAFESRGLGHAARKNSTRGPLSANDQPGLVLDLFEDVAEVEIGFVVLAAFALTARL